ncbi:RNA polymerase sigma-70 factor [Dyadobacter tibetensis]|uniref:RNA polymerase sigma-70 factor n=1 Tax=Dyadobacter tibetensis TaxID=1211851 RepID=UPI0004716AC4|nr:RNA polymerase sigma-70 factor [Dyadobacter tibetensis]
MSLSISQKSSDEGLSNGSKIVAKKTQLGANNHDSELREDNESFVKGVFKVDPAKGCELLFRLYYQPLCSYSARFVYSREAAEDIVSEIFYNLWNSQSYKAITVSYRAYLFRSVRNRSYNYLASDVRNKTPISSLELEELPSAESPEEMMQIDELLCKIHNVVNGLPPKCKEIFVMSRFEGHKPKQIAIKLDLSVRTVENHLFKALCILRNALKEYWLWATLLLIQ